MITWLRSHFKNKSTIEPQEPPKKQLNVGEPVLTFVQTVLNEPDRFTIRLSKDASTRTRIRILTDKKLKVKWKFGILTFNDSVTICGPSWLTEDECEYLYKKLKPWAHQYSRSGKLRKIQRERATRLYPSKGNV